MKTGIVLLLVLSLAGCARIHLVCPTNGVETVTIGGSQVGYTLLSMASTATQAAKFGATPPTAPADTSTVDYTYVPIFGQDFASCGNMPNPPTPPK